MADEQSLPIDPFQASAAIAEAHVHDAELIALAGRMGLHSLDVEQLRIIAAAGVNVVSRLGPTRPFAATVAARWAVDPEFRQACRDEGLSAPQIPVTDEMIKAARELERAIGVRSDIEPFTAIYRAMAAVAPVELVSANEDRIAVLEAVNASLSGRVEELQSYSHELAKEIDRRNGLDQQTEAYQYLKRLFLHMEPQCCVLPDLLGVCTQVDNAIAGLQIELKEATSPLTPFGEQCIAALAAENVSLKSSTAMQDQIYAERPETLFSARQKISDERDAVLARVTELKAENAELTEKNASLSVSVISRGKIIEAKDARIAELKSQLAMRVTTKPTAAQQTAGDIDPVAEPKPKAMPANALKPTPTDSRRIGG